MLDAGFWMRDAGCWMLVFELLRAEAGRSLWQTTWVLRDAAWATEESENIPVPDNT
jgi:hypothetical protein